MLCRNLINSLIYIRNLAFVYVHQHILFEHFIIICGYLVDLFMEVESRLFTCKLFVLMEYNDVLR